MNITISGDYIDLESIYFDLIEEGWSEDGAYDEIYQILMESGAMVVMEDLLFLH